MRDMLDSLLIVETPEGVRLSLHLAGMVPRSLAFGIDMAVRGVVMIACATVLGKLGNIGLGLLLIIFFLMEWLYPVLFEVYGGGSTPGKRMMGLTVVEASGLPVGWRASMIRNLLRFADFLPFFYGFAVFSLLHTARFQRLGDLAADTVVVWRQKPQVFGELPERKPIEPPVRLTPEEQRSLINFAERAGKLSMQRQIELSDRLKPLTGATGQSGLERVLGMANYLAGKR
ncbi:putative RDD family membrane protein YckC [Fluviicoccus keumensis]|uniref:Putative RDD family membrane protein YckC n=1 Tax=Fluviicoccus keumensis TaxID=1435465 RepID=A0A4Q7Z4D4_9GAMM|nr:RDD family protein [Fluviicoccus keumensis]RZU45118.1 putative RDD family membrane protein YckC [Fluviicoccus keumensis]